MKAPRQYHYSWEWRLAATPSALWPYVSDTNRFNRDAGVPALEEMAGSTPGSRHLRLRKYGVLVEWLEEPFEWIRPRSFSVMRRYDSGPVAEMRVAVELHADGPAHTRMRYDVTAIPRNAIGQVAIPLEIGLISKYRFGAVFRRYALAAAAQGQTPALPQYAEQRVDLLPRAAPLVPGGAERLERARATLRERFDAQLIERLLEVVRCADDLTAIRIRPYQLADAWCVPRRALLSVCLHATRIGLLDLQWDVLCPMCRGPKQTNVSLGGIAQPVHCDGCNIDFNANFEQSVELTFKPSPAIRSIEIFPFCVGGPQLTPHIVMQQLIGPGESRALPADLEPGRYRVRAPDLAGAQHFEVGANGEERIDLVASQNGWQNREPAIAMGGELTVINRSARSQLMIIERVAWSDQALTAAEVIALQEFRDLFSSEALRPGEAISVGSMAILFTDLRDSTRLYREIGDAPAFGRVLDHFDVLRTAMQEEDGALVKTIGDAVMAVFRRPAAALRTIFRAQQLLAALPEGVRPPNLKAGVHYGPCIAVTLNERLDYFGSTVNIAARAGALSGGGCEIIISRAVADDPEVQELLREAHVSATSFEAHVKGYDDAPLQLLRVCSSAKTVASPS